MSLKQNIIYLYFKGKHLITSKPQYQYNHGQYLYFADLNLPQTFEVHFSNKERGESKTQIGSNKLVEIPDEYFWSGALEIYAWVYLHSGTDDGETIYEVKIPLIKRAKPTDEEPLPVQQSAIDKAISELNNAVDITNENVDKTNADKTQVATIKEEVVTLKEEIDSTANTVSQDAQSARESADASEQSAQNSAESERKALDYSDEAKGYAQSALESKNTTSQKVQVAIDASAEAKGYRDEALEAKRGIVDYRDETLTAKNKAESFANNAAQSASNAKNDADFLRNASATATTLPEGSNATATLNNGLFEFGIPKGDTGDKGDTGNSGVYIGTDEPTDENVNVWVDTDGNMDTLIEKIKIFYLEQTGNQQFRIIDDNNELHDCIINGIPTMLCNVHDPTDTKYYLYAGSFFDYIPYHVWASAPFAYLESNYTNKIEIRFLASYDFETIARNVTVNIDATVVQ